MPFYNHPGKKIACQDLMTVEQNQDTQTPSVPTNPGIWEKCLAKATIRDETKNIHLVVLGAQGCGKTTLVQSIVGKSLQLERDGFLLEYSYSPPDLQREFCMHIWQLRDDSQLEVLKAVLPKEEVEHIAYIICIDISKPYLVEEEFKKWTTFLRKMDPFIGINALENQKEVEVEEELAAQDLTDCASCPWTSSPNCLLQADATSKIPVIFAGTRADLFSKNYTNIGMASDKFKYIMAYIRRASYKLGGSTFVTAKGQVVSQGSTIRNYLRHILFPLEFSFGLEPMTPSLESITKEYYFMSAESDSVSSILQSLPNSPFSSVFPLPQTVKCIEHKTCAIEDDKFLKFLWCIVESTNKKGKGVTLPGGGRPLKRSLSSRELRAKARRRENRDGSSLCQSFKEGGGANKKAIGEFYKRLLESSTKNSRITNTVLLDLAGVEQT